MKAILANPALFAEDPLRLIRGLRLVSQLGLPNHLASYKLSDADLREAVRPVASAENPEADLLGILRAAL